MRAFLAITVLWDLSDEERRRVLGNPSAAEHERWYAAARDRHALSLQVETLTRMSAVLGIHQALGILHSNPADGMAWLRRSHAATPFDGRPPLALATEGTLETLLTVRRFLDAACCGGYMAPNEIDDDPFLQHEVEVVFR